MIYPNHLRLLDLTIQIHTMRHHHQIVGLRPSNEASPRGLHEITSLHEAPPRDLRELRLGLEAPPRYPSWNYILMLRHQHKPSP